MAKEVDDLKAAVAAIATAQQKDSQALGELVAMIKNSTSMNDLAAVEDAANQLQTIATNMSANADAALAAVAPVDPAPASTPVDPSK